MKQTRHSVIVLLGSLALIMTAALAACGSPPLPEEDNPRSWIGPTDLTHGLPNWATPEELAQASRAPLPEDRAAPAPGRFVLPAEYAPMQAVLMTWTSYTSILSQVAQHVANAGAQVWAVGGPSSITGVPADKYKRYSFSYNTVWSRDYGPFGINLDTQQLAIVDTTYRHYAYRQSDDAIPCNLASSLGASCHTTALILDGGNLMTDGQGTLFMTRRTYEWNSSKTQAQVDQYLRDYLGATTIHVLDYAGSGSPADGTGHIDMFAKLLGPCKVLVAQTSSTTFKATVDAAATFFGNLECAPGQRYQVYRIPAWSSGGTWYTYTNSLIVNNTVIVPSYSGADNEGARAIYQQAMPGYNIVLVNSDASITSGGSIHCITREIPRPPTTDPTNLPPTANAGPDQTASIGQLVTLQGTGSDPEGQPLSATWTQVAGPTVSLSGATSFAPSFTVPAVTGQVVFTFQLVVNDGTHASAADTVSVTVSGPSPWTFEASATDTPKAIPDNNATGITSSIQAPAGQVGQAEVTLRITHTYIGDLKVTLTCPSGSSQVLHANSGGSADNLDKTYAVTACNGQSAAGAWRLTVADTASADTGTLTAYSLRLALDAPANRPPLASAGADQGAKAGEWVQLDGSASSDPDGDRIYWTWTQAAGPAVTLSEPTAVQPWFVAPAVSTTTVLTFGLIVDDGQDASLADQVSITVRPAGG